jgi:hypothetical protein
VGVQPERPDQPDRPEGDDEDQAWRAIVENYGERAELDEPPAPEPPRQRDAPFGGRFGDLRSFGHEDEDEPFIAEEEGFEPPEPPPVPRTTPDRLAAWIGVFGSPAVLLTSLIFSISLPTYVGYLLIAGFVGGFLYLVFQMPRGPRDPWDDGAQV